MKQVTLVEWTDLLFHAEKLGFFWNFAHEILRVFQGYDRIMEIHYEEIDEYVPLSDPYINSSYKTKDLSLNPNDADLNEMGRDIVRDFMQTHNLKVMTVYNDK